MRSALVRRLVLTGLPTILILGLGLSVIWGDEGLWARHSLRQELEEASSDLAALERENQRLLRDLVRMEQDPLTLERMVAEELGWGHDDATIYRFDEDG